MVTRNILLSSTAIAALALAGCNSSNDGIAGAAQITELGLTLGEAVSVLSSDKENGVGRNVNLTVQDFGEDADGLFFEIDVELPDGDVITLDEDDFSARPDTIWIDSIDNQLAQRYRTTVGGNGVPGDVVDVIIGFGVADDNLEHDANPLMALARFGTEGTIDPSAEITERDGQIFDVYAVTGELTDTESLPTGWAEYRGNHAATVYVNSENFDAPLVADGYGTSICCEADEDVFIKVDFATGSGEAAVEGRYDYIDSVSDLNTVGSVEVFTDNQHYTLISNDIQISDATYSGILAFTVGALDLDEGDPDGVESHTHVPTSSEAVTRTVPILETPEARQLWTDFGLPAVGGSLEEFVAQGGMTETLNFVAYSESTRIDLTGEIAGEFYGDAAQATGGVFAAEETGTEAAWNDGNLEVDIIGGYVAYEDNASEAAPTPPPPGG